MDSGDAIRPQGLAAYSSALARDAQDALGGLAARRTRTAFSVGPLTVRYETEAAPTADDAATQAAASLHRMRAFNFADSLQTQQLMEELASASGSVAEAPATGALGQGAPLEALTGTAPSTRTPAAGARAYARSASLSQRPPMYQADV